MLELDRRHNPAKCKLTNREERKCHCSILVKYWLNGKLIPRRSMKTRMWGQAEREVERWQQDPEKRERDANASTTLKEATESYMTNCANVLKVQDTTLRTCQKTFEHFVCHAV